MKIQEALNPQDFLTLLNASFGILSIFFSVEGNFLAAAILMLLAVAFDYLDGKLGRIIKRTHKFGKELDSLCDVVSFGIAPSVFGYTYHEYIYNSTGTLLTVILVLFVLCGILRLARFNITKLKGYFEGMPITMNGIIIPLIYFVKLPVKYYFIVYLLSAALMISTLKIKKIG